MFINYLKLAWRNLWKRKSFTLLNIAGLTVAFGIAILLCTAALFDLSFDKFHNNRGSIYKIYTTSQTPKGAEASINHPVPFAEALRSEVPGVNKISRFAGGKDNITYGSKEFVMGIARVDTDFFDIFSFPALSAGRKPLLREGSDVVLTETAALRIFNSKDVVGKTILISTSGTDNPYTIIGVLKDFPDQSSLRFDIAIRFENYGGYEGNKSRWDNMDHEVYVQLDDNVKPSDFEKSTRKFSNIHFASPIAAAKRDGAKPDESGQFQQIRLLPFEHEHFARYSNGLATVNKARSYLIIGIALLLIFIACVNFVNMSIGTSVQRLREIGMRKTLGAAKHNCFFNSGAKALLSFCLPWV